MISWLCLKNGSVGIFFCKRSTDIQYRSTTLQWVIGENKTKLICNYAKWKTTTTKVAVQKLANVKKHCLRFLVVSNYYNQSSGVEGSLSFLHAGDTFLVCFGGSLQCKQRRQGKIKNIKPMFVELL